MDPSDLNRWLDERCPAAVVRGLRPFLTAERAARIEKMLESRLGSVHVAVEHPQDPHNAAAVVRSAEALGAMHVHVVGAEGQALHAQNTTQGAYRWVHTHHHQTLDGLLDTLRPAQVRLFGALMTGTYPLEELPVDQPFCLLFGNESRGLSQRALSACEASFRIPMTGMSESLNLSVSAAIALYATTRARRAFLQQPGDLEGPARQRERARCYAQSVDDRLLHALPTRA